MKKWKDLNDTDKNMLFLYKKALGMSNVNDDEKDECLKLAKYCLLNNLCVSTVPETKIYDETYQKIHLASPMVFNDLYDDVVWVDENNELIKMF